MWTWPLGDMPRRPATRTDGKQLQRLIDRLHWDTWIVPVLGGQPRLWLPNASGLVWLEQHAILFSEIKDNNLHMAIVSAADSRAAEHDVYVPPGDRGMAHRSAPSPDRKLARVVEMDHALWLPCKLVSLDDNSPVRAVGPGRLVRRQRGQGMEDGCILLLVLVELSIFGDSAVQMVVLSKSRRGQRKKKG